MALRRNGHAKAAITKSNANARKMNSRRLRSWRGLWRATLFLGAVILPFLVCLGLTAVAVLIPQGLAGIENAGPHGFSEIFYAYISQMGNNGSALAGLTVNTPFYTVTGAFDMLVCRMVPILAALALGGSVALENIVPFTAGTLRTDTRLFTGLLVGVIVVIGALTFLPGLALGPIVEHLIHGRLF